MKQDESRKIESSWDIMLKQYRYIIAELPKILPIAYLCMIGIGMIFNYYKYVHFGINIFQYASVFDFLISPFEDFFIIFFTLFSLSFCAFVFYSDWLFEKKYPKLYKKLSFNMTDKKGYQMFRFYLYSFVILAYIWLAAIFYGQYSYNRVLKQQDIEVQYYNNETAKGKQIGKTNDVLFLLEEDGTTRAVPIGSLVKGIRYGEMSPFNNK